MALLQTGPSLFRVWLLKLATVSLELLPPLELTFRASGWGTALLSAITLFSGFKTVIPLVLDRRMFEWAWRKATDSLMVEKFSTGNVKQRLRSLSGVQMIFSSTGRVESQWAAGARTMRTHGGSAEVIWHFSWAIYNNDAQVWTRRDDSPSMAHWKTSLSFMLYFFLYYFWIITSFVLFCSTFMHHLCIICSNVL